MQYQQHQQPMSGPPTYPSIPPHTMMGNSHYPMHATAGPQMGMNMNMNMGLQLPRPNANMPPPASGSQEPPEPQMSGGIDDKKYKYSLSVEQQPARARMCGFGDKDRRPITPPPCVRLVITDKSTGREVDINELDGSFFVLQVDLWSSDARNEVNIVRASSGSPATSISTATTTSFPPTAERPVSYGHVLVGQPQYAQYAGGQQWAYSQPHYSQPMMAAPPSMTSSTTMFTRNLIGSLTVNASRLTDPDGKSGYWFVLQDLSVRTEGWFRLKMNFINVAAPDGGEGLNKGRAPVLAWTFSEKFQVYSAKKFPGVIESTVLSKCFAQQGIKIPIRKDGKGGEDDEKDD